MAENSKQKVLDAIYIAVAQVNELRPSDSQLECVESELILGDRSKLDSLGFVTLMVGIEQAVKDGFGNCPSLAIELTKQETSVKDIGDLATFITDTLD